MRADTCPGEEVNSPLAVSLLVFAGIGLPSALLWALPVGQRVIGFGLLLLCAGFITVTGRTISLFWLNVMVLNLFLSTITAIYWNTLIPVALFGYFALGLFVTSMASLSEIRRAVEIVTVILLVLAVFGWISMTYFYRGGESLLTIQTPGQPVTLYLATLAVPTGGLIMRPAGIFDEPGAFAFFISLCAACRMLLGLPRARTWQLLVAGLTTLSLALVIFIFVVGVGELVRFGKKQRAPISARAKRRARMLGLFAFAAVIWFVVEYHKEILVVGEFLFIRLRPSSEAGRLIEGDSRTADFMTSLGHLDLRTILFGIDRSCFTDLGTCYAMDFGGGSNPLSPIVMRGLLSQFLYYFVLVVLLAYSIRGPNRAVYFAVMLMFLQRPYVLSFGYSTWAVLALLINEKMRSHSTEGSRAFPPSAPLTASG